MRAKAWSQFPISAEMKDHLATTQGRRVLTSFPNVEGFLERYYRYKSVQFPRDAGLAKIPYTGQKFLAYKEANQRYI